MDTLTHTTHHHAAEEASIRQLVAQLTDCWNAGDGQAYAAPFTDNADFINIYGWHFQGRQAIAEGHQQIFATIYKDSQNASTVTGIRFVRADVALAHVRWHLRYWQGQTSVENRAMNTMVLVKVPTPSASPWQITAFHNTPIVNR